MASIQVSADKLKQACENYLAQRNQRIAEKKDKIIKSYVGKRKHWLFGEKYTYETAKADLDKNSSSFDAYRICEWSGGFWASKAEDMLALTKHGDPVTLTDEDIWIMEYV